MRWDSLGEYLATAIGFQVIFMPLRFTLYIDNLIAFYVIVIHIILGCRIILLYISVRKIFCSYEVLEMMHKKFIQE